MSKILSIITVSYNSRNTITETFNSIKAVKNQNIEYIVIDGASKDGTPDLIKEHSSIIDYWVSERDKGLYDAMNKGLAAANGKYVMFLNSDDFLNAPEFQKMMDVVSRQDKNWYFCDVNVLEEDGTPSGKISPVEAHQSGKYLFYMPIAHPGTLMDTKSLQQIGGFKPEFGSASDYEMVLRYIEKFGTGQKIPLAITNYRLGGISALPTTKKLKEHWKIWNAHNYPLNLRVSRYLRDTLSLAINRGFPPLAKAIKKLKKSNYISPL